MGNNQSHPPGRSGSGSSAVSRGRDRAMSNTPMDIDALSEPLVASGSHSQDGIAQDPAESSRSGSPEPDLGLAVPRYGTNSRRRRYQESTSTASSSRSRISSSQADQKFQPEADTIASRPSIGRRISSAFSRRSGSRRASPSPRHGDHNASDLHDKPHENPIPEHRQQTLEAERGEEKRERGQRGQGETKRRRISGMFSPTPSRSNSAADFGADEAERNASSNTSRARTPEADARREPISMPHGSNSQVERYAGRESTETTGVDILTDAGERQKAADGTLDTARVPDVPVGVPGSPPIVPLTDADPLLDDRLRTLSTIWEVLGSDVARSLPAVATAEAVRRASVTGPRSGVESDAPEMAVEEGVPEMDLASLPALPPSTISLLDDLEADTRSRNATSLGANPTASLDALLSDATSAVFGTNGSIPPLVAPPTTPAYHPILEPSEPFPAGSSLQPPVLPRLTSRTSATSVSTAGTSATAISDGPGNNRANERRRGRMGGLAERVGSWFGIAGSDSARDTPSPPAASPRQSATPLGTETAVPSNADTTQRDPGAPQRLQQGAVMIVQGFVQTSMSRERPDSQSSNTALHSEAEATPLYSSSHMGQNLEQREAHDQQQASEETSSISGTPIDNNRPNPMSRRASEGDHPQDRPDSSRRPSIFSRRSFAGRQRISREPEAPTFTDQARMLAGLLSVATAATASSLLALPSGDGSPASSASEASTEPQSGPGATLAALRRRLQNSNANSAPATPEDSGLESVLRSYMQRAMSGNQEATPETTSATVSGETAERWAPGSASPPASSERDDNPGLATILPNAEASSFEEFLNNMQYSLIQSLREFNNDPTLPSSRETPASSRGAEPAVGRPSVGEDDIAETPTSHVEPPVHATPLPMEIDEDTGGSNIPVSSDAAARSAEPLNTEDSPPHLSFFRMYQFPARDQPPVTNPPATGDAALPTSLIPAVIVGVRSINRDISTINGETAAQAPFPFSDAADMQNQTQNETEPDLSEDALTRASRMVAPEASLVDATDPSVNVPTEHRSRIMRALRALVQRDEQRARQQAEAARRAAAFITHNYVIWVVGGNYPAGHPILTIPHLFTGELSHDDLWALSEALGQHKPPVATEDDIAKAGLQVVKGLEIPEAVQDGRVHEMCLDRCLVCLSDYEPEEDCRVMTCRHAFHVECIDRWLKTGRNSCPACRQAGVKTSSGRDADTSDPVVPTDQSHETHEQPTQTAAASEEVVSHDHDTNMA